GIGVITAWGAGSNPTPGRNQIRTRMSRRLAGLGFHVLRMDYRGVGESAGTARPVNFTETWSADVLAAYHWLMETGVRQVVLIGYCFGGRNVLSAGYEIPNVASIILIGSPVADQDHVETRSREESF